MTLQEVIAASPYIPSWHETGACMDRRHIMLLREVIQRTGVRRTLEIGVHSGASSTAFAGVPDAHHADITSRDDARSMMPGTFHHRKGADVLRDEAPFDLVLVDGNHGMEAVQEELEVLMAKPPRIIVAHDINSSAVGFPHCEGAHLLWQHLQADLWWCIVDAADRPGEMTKRGLLVATKDRDAIRHILDAYRSII